MGTHQRRALRWLWLGSTVHPLLRAANLPVLCVPSLAAEEAPQPLAEIRSVLLASDLSPLSREAVAHAYGLVKPLRGVVHICHVHESPAARPLHAASAAPANTLSAQAERELRVALAALVPEQAAAAGIATRISILEANRADEAICQAARRLGVDAICLASHGRTGLAKTFLGSVAHGVLAHADRPVFVVRARRS
jgi:nucleotide-binding universal stress UspA family protein